MSVHDVVAAAIPVGIVAVLVGVWVVQVRDGIRHERLVRKAHVRAKRAHYAAIEAAEDSPSFSPETIEWSTLQIIALAARVWREGEDVAPDSRPDAAMITAWARARQSQLDSSLKTKGKPAIDLIRVVNRGEEEDRVVVRVALHLRCRRATARFVGGYTIDLDERWTLGRCEGTWLLRSVDGNPLTTPVLTAPLIPNRSFDDERLTEESLAELADTNRVATDSALIGLVSADEAPALALLDVSVLDSRFMPPLIEAELAHIVDAWELAVSGSQAPLAALASSAAMTALLGYGPASG